MSKLQQIIETLQAAGATVKIGPSSELVRQWIFVQNIKLETLQGLFTRIQVSITGDTSFAFPEDTVELS